MIDKDAISRAFYWADKPCGWDLFMDMIPVLYMFYMLTGAIKL